MRIGDSMYNENKIQLSTDPSGTSNMSETGADDPLNEENHLNSIDVYHLWIATSHI